MTQHCARTNPSPPDMRALMSRRGFLRAGAGVTLVGAVAALGGEAAWAEACDAAMGTVPGASNGAVLTGLATLFLGALLRRRQEVNR
jgi:MYXO-CTERM domain-containing protein